MSFPLFGNRKQLAILFTAICCLVSPVVGSEWQLVYASEAAKDPLAEWEIVSGTAQRDGKRIQASDNALLVFRIPLAGAQKIEFRGGSDRPGDLSPLLASDGRSVDSGYLLAFGGYENSMNRSLRLGEPITLDETAKIEPGQTHLVTAEFDGNRARLSVDGRVIHDFEDPLPLHGPGHDRVGIYINTEGWVEGVRIFTKEHAPTKAAEPPVPESPAAEGDNLLRGGDGEAAEDLAQWSGFIRQNTTHARSGRGSLEMNRLGLAKAPGWIPIDPSATYEISGWFRSANPEQPSRVLLDVRFFDAEKRPLDNFTVGVASPLLALARPAAVGDTELVLSNPTGWELPPRGGLRVALHAREDFSDLPNFQTLPTREVQTAGETLVVRLEHPLEQELAPGSTVRFHRYLNYARVVTENPRYAPFEWKRYAFQISTNPDLSKPVAGSIWPGTAYARVVIIHQYHGHPLQLPEGAPVPVLQLDDLEIRKGTPGGEDPP